MANSIDAAHAPAVNHPAQRLAGYSVTHSAAAPEFTTTGLIHGTESVASTTAAAIGAAAGWVSGGGGVYVPTAGTVTPGANPSYTVVNGGYIFNGNSGVPGDAAGGATLAQAMANWAALNPAGSANNKPAAATTAAATTTPTDFSQLATLLSSIAGSSPVASTVPADSAGTSVPTTSAPSPVIPLLLILLACGVAYWWWSSHHKKKHAAAAS